jgi:hypothetical protein
MNGTCKLKCTVFIEVKARSRGWLTTGAWLAALVFGASLCGIVPVALADTELGHNGLTGRHRLADLYESPGAICDIVLPGHDSLGETWIRVNPPIMFAINRTDGVDEQPIGWRATVSTLNERTGVWRVVRRGAMTRTMATDQLASYFNGRDWLAGLPLTHATYSVSVEMVWYAPDDPSRIEGRATHAVEHFSILLRHNGQTIQDHMSGDCRSPR